MTRLYPTTFIPSPTTAFDAGWEATGTAVRRMLALSSNSVYNTSPTFVTTSVANDDVLALQMESTPLQAQTISGTIKGQIRVREENAGADARAQVKVYVVDAAGTTVRGTLLDYDTAVLSSEFVVDLATPTNRKFPRGGAVALSSLAIQDGDKIIIEIGFRNHGTTVTNVRFNFSGAATADLAEDETSTGAAYAWFEFSQDLLFQSASNVAWGVPKLGTAVEVASGNITLIEPVGIAEGDLEIACIAYRSNAAFTVPTDWTQVEVQNTGDTDASSGIASGLMMYCIRGASAPTLTFNRTLGDVAQGNIISYTGGGVKDVSSSNTLGAVSNTATTGALVTTVPNELLVVMASPGDSSTSSAFTAATDPATASGTVDTTTNPTRGVWLQRFNRDTFTGADSTLGIADAVKEVPGSTGTIQSTNAVTSRGVMIAAAFKLNTSPSVALNTPTDVGTVTSLTPNLAMTGTDNDNNDATYEVQIDTSSAFTSQSTGGTVYAMVEAWGGGGSGGSAVTNPRGSGGGGGAYARIVNYAVTHGVGYTVTVGAGGPATAGAGNGTAGGDSSFNSASILLAKGGASGKTSGAAASGGLASASIGNVAYSGGTGAAGATGTSGGGGGGAGNAGNGGNGAAPTAGVAGNAGGGAGGTGDSSAGAIPGGGGGGVGGSGASKAGADGKVVIRVPIGLVTSATGGTKTSDATYDYWTFTANGTWTPTIAGPLIYKKSNTDAGYTDITNGADTDPFASTNQIQYAVQAANTLTNGVTYYWRARAADPKGTNQVGNWATVRSFIVTLAVRTSDFFHFFPLGR